MSKRFRDTGIWKKEWYRKLTPEQKCAWAYLCDECDSVGVLALDKESANFFIGAKINWEKLVEVCNGNIEVLSNGKWFLVDFCAFQYGRIKDISLSKVQQNLCSLLRKHGLWERYVATVGATVGTKVQEEELDKVKEEEEEKEEEKEEEALRAAAKLKKRMGVK